jgi:predicted RNase H-like nuclease (RuvC/YqgF family)
MSQESGSEEKDLKTEIAELQKRVKNLEETVASMKLKMTKKWV